MQKQWNEKEVHYKGGALQNYDGRKEDFYIRFVTVAFQVITVRGITGGSG